MRLFLLSVTTFIVVCLYRYTKSVSFENNTMRMVKILIVLLFGTSCQVRIYSLTIREEQFSASIIIEKIASKWVQVNGTSMEMIIRRRRVTTTTLYFISYNILGYFSDAILCVENNPEYCIRHIGICSIPGLRRIIIGLLVFLMAKCHFYVSLLGFFFLGTIDDYLFLFNG